jgi:hypothetical protein
VNRPDGRSNRLNARARRAREEEAAKKQLQALKRSKNPTGWNAGYPTIIKGPAPVAFWSTPGSDSNRLLEFELLHQWMTRFWVGLHYEEGDRNYLLDFIPRTAMHNSYMLNGIFAATAIDLAHCASDPAISNKYLCAALEYGNRATAEFRLQLRNINQDNFLEYFYFGMIHAITHYMMPSENPSVLDRVVTFFNMNAGLFKITYKWIDTWVNNGSNTLQRFVHSLKDGSIFKLDIMSEDSKAAIARMKAIGQLVRVPVRSDDGLDDNPFAADVMIYKIAAGMMHLAFIMDAQITQEDFNKNNQGLNGSMCLSLTTAPGEEFNRLLEEREPVALFILLHFSVLLHKFSKMEEGFWVRLGGKDLTEELSEFLMGTQIAHYDEGRESIAWAREKVGLPPLEEKHPSWLLPTIVVDQGTTPGSDESRLVPLTVSSDEGISVSDLEYASHEPWLSTDISPDDGTLFAENADFNFDDNSQSASTVDISTTMPSGDYFVSGSTIPSHDFIVADRTMPSDGYYMQNHRISSDEYIIPDKSMPHDEYSISTVNETNLYP